MITILCGQERTDWINPKLMQTLFQMQRDKRFECCLFPVQDVRPFELARNVSVEAARKANVDWLVSFDNDNFMYGYNTPLDALAIAKDRRVISFPCGLLMEGQVHMLEHRNEFTEVRFIGTGIVAIHRTVWEKIPAQWFKWVAPEFETVLETGDLRSGCGESVFFQRRAQEHGFKLWAAPFLCGHYKTVDLTQLFS
jgi:hypothetical protein